MTKAVSGKFGFFEAVLLLCEHGHFSLNLTSNGLLLIFSIGLCRINLHL